MIRTCEKCGSDKIIPEVNVFDQGDYSVEGQLNIGLEENPDAFFFRKSFRTALAAKVCGECGFIEFYARKPDQLYSAYQNQQANLKNDK